MANIEQCGNCLYSMTLASQKTCFCRRHAPTPVLGNIETESLARFPVVRIDWWCGDYKEDE